MGDKRWYDGRWIAIPEIDGIAYIEPHWHEEAGFIGKEHYKHKIGMDEFHRLCAFLVESGYIKPTFAENRTEDIKVIHRLIDVVEKGVVHEPCNMA
jgi:hypothetical protein